MIYDAYYGVCIDALSIDDAEGRILQAVNVTLSDDYLNEDAIIAALDDSSCDTDRAKRDESRVRVLERLNSALHTDLKRNNQSVIQEYGLDMALLQSSGDR